MGLIGEYVGRVYDEAKGRPHFVVAEVAHNRDAQPLRDAVVRTAPGRAVTK
jgi:hypothetical protein